MDNTDFPTHVAPYVVAKVATLEEAMIQIEENAHRSVVVVDGRKVVGVLSDGDLRKAILDKRLLSTPVSEVMNVSFASVTPDTLEHAKDLFAKPYILLVPVVDSNLQLVDILTAY